MRKCIAQFDNAADLSTFDAFFAEEQSGPVVPSQAESSLVTVPVQTPDTPASFEAKRRRLQANVHRNHSGRPPDLLVSNQLDLASNNSTCDYSPKSGTPPIVFALAA